MQKFEIGETVTVVSCDRTGGDEIIGKSGMVEDVIPHEQLNNLGKSLVLWETYGVRIDTTVFYLGDDELEKA